LDTAEMKEIETGLEWGMVDGITTNPSLIAKSGRAYLPTVQAIAKLVPVPLTPAGLRAVATLKKEGIRTNVTLCFSAAQALLAAKAGAGYISPFIGRLDDVAEDGMELIDQVVTIYRNYSFDTKVLVASVRHPIHVVQSAMLGADVATIPFKVLEQLYKHPLADVGLDRFLADWKKTGKSFDES